ncbi:helix-turn-helix domain-containing protein [Asticcacaulis sp. EMRT-3]|uniref:TetR/AcrR family transcriptional regulator n=1 Tax=Asticcacaulis sp. EMRT-3 TaxID=3040349 RepID=UPI0024AFC09C|nr:helix-turn-helix domain-containing protein [Asticcacaulis sp. EMRT-3]MDI7776002.1 helix-turn-helix domain-containing protein [Asticcacaulis sp. EMRT-3]
MLQVRSKAGKSREPSSRDGGAKDTPKSRRTRVQILETAMRLFAELGYDRAGNAAIAEACGLTRGAMLYHFPTREALIEAAAWHIQAAREAAFEIEAGKLKPGQDALDGAIDAYWQLLSSVPFAAFLALERAGRQDAEVARAIAPAQEAFDKGAMGRATPGFIMAGNDPRFQVSRDLARFALDGMHRSAITYDHDARVEHMLSVIKRAVHMLNRKGDVTDLWSE